MSRKTILSFLVIVAIFIYAKSLPPQKGEVREASDVKETATPTQEPTPTTTPTPTPTPSFIPSPIPTLRPTSVPQSQSITISAFIYPNARQVGTDDDKILLETSDNPDAVTDWYKNKIKSFSMNAKSFVQTNTNGNVLNKLVGDNGEIEVRIEIIKKANDSVTKISVSVEPS